EAVDYGMGLKQSHTWNRFGEGRRLKIIETIDEKLVELAQEILVQEKESIDLLDKIGEIKGLLINLYT
ncbi:MAG: YaaR family protein, partial [Planococcaceae bacterium]|nr:YaaR family protein [Planococcaceae bacterium]